MNLRNYTRFAYGLRLPPGWAPFPVEYTLQAVHSECDCGSPDCGMRLRQKRGHVMIVMDVGDLFDITWWISSN